MAGQNRGSFSDLKIDLLKNGRTYSFFQVVRLLRSFCGTFDHTEDARNADRIRVRPNLSLAFPSSDVDRVEEIRKGEEPPHFLITANFLGLYGVSSPLPTFYTEDLMDEAAEDESVTREFLDLINQRLFFLLFDAWKKYRQFVQVVEDRNEDHLVRLFSLLGLGERVLRKDVPNAFSLIRYIGLMTQFPRSALGLKCLLQDALGNVYVDVISCLQRKVSIPKDQRLILGAAGRTLGRNSYVGEEIDDRMGKFRLCIGPVNARQFQELLPQGKRYEQLIFLTRFYVIDGLEFDVEITLAQGEAGCVCLGRPEWSRLGLSSWIFSDEELGEVSMRFCP